MGEVGQGKAESLGGGGGAGGVGQGQEWGRWGRGGLADIKNLNVAQEVGKFGLPSQACSGILQAHAGLLQQLFSSGWILDLLENIFTVTFG